MARASNGSESHARLGEETCEFALSERHVETTAVRDEGPPGGKPQEQLNPAAKSPEK